jgi:hypothetical protein
MTNTTNRGWAKPDGASTPDVPYWLGQLADNVDAALPDTGWVDVTTLVTPAAGFTTTLARARLLNGMLEVSWNGSTTAAITAPSSGDLPNTKVCTFPAPYRPTLFARSIGTNASGPFLAWVFTTAGTVEFVSAGPGQTVPAGADLSCNGVMSI